MTSVLFPLSSVQVQIVTAERLSERVAEFIAEAVRQGWVKNQTDALGQANISSGWFRELQNREAEYYAAVPRTGTPPTMLAAKAAALARVLRVSADEILGTAPPGARSEIERNAAVEAARALQYSEKAIAEIQQRAATPGLSRLQWLRLIESIQGWPAAGSGSELSELPRDSQRQR